MKNFLLILTLLISTTSHASDTAQASDRTNPFLNGTLEFCLHQPEDPFDLKTAVANTITNHTGTPTERFTKTTALFNKMDLCRTTWADPAMRSSIYQLSLYTAQEFKKYKQFSDALVTSLQSANPAKAIQDMPIANTLKNTFKDAFLVTLPKKIHSRALSHGYNPKLAQALTDKDPSHKALHATIITAHTKAQTIFTRVLQEYKGSYAHTVNPTLHLCFDNTGVGMGDAAMGIIGTDKTAHVFITPLFCLFHSEAEIASGFQHELAHLTTIKIDDVLALTPEHIPSIEKATHKYAVFHSPTPLKTLKTLRCWIYHSDELPKLAQALKKDGLSETVHNITTTSKVTS